MTAKQLEQETGCKIMVRGKGSMRDKKKVSSDLYILIAPCVAGGERIGWSVREIGVEFMNHIHRISRLF